MTRGMTKPRQRAETPAEWLEELGGALRMPYERAEAIREELAEHLRERVRDLELEGLSEAAAASVAVRELGDAAAVARRFRNAEKTPIRRRIMNLAVIGIAGAALMTSVIAIRGEQSPKAEQAQVLLERAVTVMREDPTSEDVQPLLEQAVKAVDSSQRAKELRLRIETAIAGTDETGITLSLVPELMEGLLSQKVQLSNVRQSDGPVMWEEAAIPHVGKSVAAIELKDARVRDVLERIAKDAGLAVHIRWSKLEEVGVQAEDVVDIRFAGGDVAEALMALNEARGVLERTSDQFVDLQVREGTIEFAPRRYFDRRESRVVCYDIGTVLDAGVDLEQLAELVTGFVEPDVWVNNGGDLASFRIVGRRMFVKAPPRMQDGVKWFVERVAEQGNRGARKESSGQREETRTYALKHASAGDVLKAISTNQQIRAIDFTHFVADERTNSIIGRTTAPEHRMVEEAIESLDVEIAEGRTASVK